MPEDIETGPRRYIRDYSDPLNKYCAQEFQARYRFTPEAVKNCILPILICDLKKPTKKGLPFTTEIMVLLTLRYLPQEVFQKLEGASMKIFSQQSVSRTVKE